MYKLDNFYSKKAKQEGYAARSVFKLEEIQDKFHLIDRNTKIVLDIGCAPGSRIQYTTAQLMKLRVKEYQVIGFDINTKHVNIKLP